MAKPDTDLSRDEEGLWIDEAPLRDWVLKAYHERWEDEGEHQPLLEAVRRLLSGPAGGPSVPGQYFFERDPATEIPAFAAELGKVAPKLDGFIFAPLLASVAEKEEEGASELAPNLSLWVASSSGPIALRAGVDETIVCALVSAALLTIARLGRSKVSESLGW